MVYWKHFYLSLHHQLQIQEVQTSCFQMSVPFESQTIVQPDVALLELNIVKEPSFIWHRSVGWCSLDSIFAFSAQELCLPDIFFCRKVWILKCYDACFVCAFKKIQKAFEIWISFWVIEVLKF